MPNPYLLLAERAVLYVNAHVAASNRADDVAKFGQEVLNNKLTAATGEIYDHNVSTVGEKSPGEYQRQVCITLGNRIGNCEAQAIVALDLLASHPHGHPRMELMCLNHWKSEKENADRNYVAPEPDHVFLVIGRAVETDLKEYKTWNADAVVCDPWARAAYVASDLKEKMYAIAEVSHNVTGTAQMYALEANVTWEPELPH